jgi:ParB-like chromosome segregation protein Spo0J
MNHPIEERPLSDLCETYASFRLISPKAETAMAQSLERYGQISPVLCLSTPAGPVVLDGFKRLRAARRMNWAAMRVICLETTGQAGKAGMIQWNRISRTITDLEEALIVRSLHRDDGLPQLEIATLVGRHKSWVSRRISLIERLHEDVRRHLELGLIGVSVGRELAKLPRGNQPACMRAILENRLGKRAVEKMIRILRGRPTGVQLRLLSQPEDLLSPEIPVPAGSREVFFRRLDLLWERQEDILAGATEDILAENEREESLLHSVITSGRETVRFLEGLLQDDPAGKEEF